MKTKKMRTLSDRLYDLAALIILSVLICAEGASSAGGFIALGAGIAAAGLLSWLAGWAGREASRRGESR